MGDIGTFINNWTPQSFDTAGNNIAAQSQQPVNDFDEEQRNVIVGYEQGTNHPYVMNRAHATKVQTSHGQILSGDENPYRLPALPTAAEYGQRHPSADLTATYGKHLAARTGPEPAMAPQPAQKNIRKPSMHSAKKASVVSGRKTSTNSVTASQPPNQEDESIRYVDYDAFARLTGDDLFRDQDGYGNGGRRRVNQSQSRASSKFSPDTGTQSTGVFRSLSNKMKGAIRRPSLAVKRRLSGSVDLLRPRSSRSQGDPVHSNNTGVPVTDSRKNALGIHYPEISAPLTDFRRGSHCVDNADARARPIRTPASDLSVRSPPPRSVLVPPTTATETDSRYPNALQARRKPPERKLVPPPPPPPPPRRREVKVVGEPDRMTQISDFVNVSESDSGPYNLPNTTYGADKCSDDFIVHPLRTSRNTTQTPKPPRTAKITSQREWRMDEEYPHVDDLFGEIDQQIADMNIPEHEKRPAAQEAHRLKRTMDRPMPGNSRVDPEDAEPEIMVDTFIHDKHSSWVVTDRPDPNTVRSEYRRFQQDWRDTAGDAEEAAMMLQRLQASEEGEDDSSDYDWEHDIIDVTSGNRELARKRSKTKTGNWI